MSVSGLDQDDELGRLIKAVKGSAIYRYEDEDYDPSVTRGGKLDESTLGSVTLYNYDLLGQVISMNRDGETTSYEYDEEGNVTLVTQSNGRSTAYTYYNDGRLYTVTYHDSEACSRTFTYAYDEAGQLLAIAFTEESGLVASFTKPNDDPGWDDNGQLLCLRYLKDDEHFHRFEYSYDDSGNRVQFIDTPEDTGEQVTWDYGTEGIT